MEVGDLPKFENEFGKQVFDLDIVSRNGLKDIYLIEGGLVIKVPRVDRWDELNSDLKLISNRDVLNGSLIGKSLYKVGVSVPKPYGVFSVDIGSSDGRNVLGFVMENVEGEDILKIKDRKSIGDVLREIELKKAINLGFEPGYDARINCILTPDLRAVLIDFDNWSVS